MCEEDDKTYMLLKFFCISKDITVPSTELTFNKEVSQVCHSCDLLSGI